jgi:hypothetical protein
MDTSHSASVNIHSDVEVSQEGPEIVIEEITDETINEPLNTEETMNQPIEEGTNFEIIVSEIETITDISSNPVERKDMKRQLDETDKEERKIDTEKTEQASPKRTKTDTDNTSTQSNPISLDENATFSMGQRIGGYIPDRRRIRKKTGVKKGKKKAVTPTQQSTPRRIVPIPQKQPPSQEYILRRTNILFRNFRNVEPFFLRRALHFYLHKQPPPLDFTGKYRRGQIVILIPNRYKNDPIRTMVHHEMYTYTGMFFDWQCYFIELLLESRKPPSFKENPHFKIKSVESIFNCKRKHLLADLIFQKNQAFRFQMRRLVNAWLIKKSKRRLIGADADIITQEPIPEAEQIRVLCLKTRCEYAFSGNCLLKSIISNLDAQSASIPNAKQPQNPFTNIQFGYGQMLEIYNSLLGWCSKHRRCFPSLLTMYYDTHFRNQILIKTHHQYIQYRATRNFIMEEDSRAVFFFENIHILIESFRPSIRLSDPSLLSLEHFKIWHKNSPKHHLLLQWRRFVMDYWHYEQTNQLIREHWRSEGSIIYDLDVLVLASEKFLVEAKEEKEEEDALLQEQEDYEIFHAQLNNGMAEDEFEEDTI